MKASLVIFAMLIAMLSTRAQSSPFDWAAYNAQVTSISAASMPSHLIFKIDTNGGTSCPAGTWLTYYGIGADSATQKDNIKVIYALLLTALATGKKIHVFNLDSATANCAVNAIHILNE